VKVGELEKGMLLQLIHPWVGTLRKYSSHPDFRLMIHSKVIADMAEWGFVAQEASIVYLGDDVELRRPRPYRLRNARGLRPRQLSRHQRIRRVLVNGTVAIIRGHDFQHLRPRPNVVKSGLAD
jgi:hypothetical protein